MFGKLPNDFDVLLCENHCSRIESPCTSALLSAGHCKEGRLTAFSTSQMPNSQSVLIQNESSLQEVCLEKEKSNHKTQHTCHLDFDVTSGTQPKTACGENQE